MNRRHLLRGIAAAPLAALIAKYGHAAPAAGGKVNLEEIRKSWKELLVVNADVSLTREPLKLSDAEWKKKLTPQQYHILREEGTEPAGTSPLDKEKRPGVFACAGCGLPLFTTAMKYDSGTGWPSFFTTIPDVFETKRDFKLILPRTEYHCVRCGGHHGHVFGDGPPPTGERWCNNGLALRFIPKSG